MFKRKLQALGFPNPDSFTSSDETQFRNMVVWLEDQKIRRYKIDERGPLRNTKLDEDWNKIFLKYLADLACPFQNSPRPELIDWLLSLAVQLEFNENSELYSGKDVAKEPSVAIISNPLDNLDFESSDFKSGVDQLADMLHIQKHPNHLTTFEAICILIKEKFRDDVLKAQPNKEFQGKHVDFNSLNFGMDFKDPNFSKAADILRYLFITDLRSLQTKINECLVVVQSLTANPKTDTKLGKVGF